MRQPGRFNPLRLDVTHMMQFAFRWQSYDSRFWMNKIVGRYRDLLIANLSF